MIKNQAGAIPKPTGWGYLLGMAAISMLLLPVKPRMTWSLWVDSYEHVHLFMLLRVRCKPESIGQGQMEVEVVLGL